MLRIACSTGCFWQARLVDLSSRRCFCASSKLKVPAYVAFGSNVGDRLRNIERACSLLNDIPLTKVLRTSGLYETKAMYVEDQDSFLNGVCEIDTELPQLDLLDQLQRIEQVLKRQKVIDKGPRTLDLDILLYNDSQFSHERLQIPHPLMLERDFVLRPLNDLVPHKKHPIDSSTTRKQSYSDHLQSLRDRDENFITPKALTFLSPCLTMSSASQSIKPLIMAIMNLTPDSFSDGGLHSTKDQEQLRSSMVSMLDSGASIIDIGGESTRPGSEAVSADEELSRIMPAVRAAVELCKKHPNAVVSVDTYRAQVADAALSAGAHVINDISGGTLDKDMFATVASHNASMILMHTRGTPQTMFADSVLLDYGSDIVRTVAYELVSRVNAAQAAGIPRWRILVDPGFGFAKNYEQNVELLQRLGELRAVPELLGLPWVVGVSRKRFVRGLAGYNAATHRTDEDVRVFAERGTVLALKQAVAHGSEVLRVHDVALVNRLLS